jgi:hypothetical protein
MKLRSSRQCIADGLLDVACHRLAELRIDLVCNRHHANQQHAEIDARQVILQRLKDADLQDDARAAERVVALITRYAVRFDRVDRITLYSGIVRGLAPIRADLAAQMRADEKIDPLSGDISPYELLKEM